MRLGLGLRCGKEGGGRYQTQGFRRNGTNGLRSRNGKQGENMVKIDAAVKANQLLNDHYIRLSRPMIAIFGSLDVAVYLCELMSEYMYWTVHNGLNEDGYFYCTHEFMKDQTGLGASEQRKSCKKLEEYGVITKKKVGMPSKNFFRFEVAGLEKLELEMGKYKNKFKTSQKDQNLEVMAKFPSFLVGQDESSHTQTKDLKGRYVF